MKANDWRQVRDRAIRTLADPNVSDDKKIEIRAALDQMEATRIAMLAELDQASAAFEEFCSDG